MSMWSEDNTKLLIRMYENYPDLWDQKLKSKNSEIRAKLWAHIAEVHKTTVQEVIKKIKTLRSKFCCEYKKYEKTLATGDPFKPSWIYFNNLMFLKEGDRTYRSFNGSESALNESNSSRQCDTEDSSIAASKLQDESQDFGSTLNYDEEEEDTKSQIKRVKLNCEEGALEDALHCIKTLLDERDKRDEHSIYGEHIAHKIRTCNRSNTDIAIAQHEIENIIFNLSMGVYAQVVDNEESKKNIVPPIIPPEPEILSFRPVFIPKADPEA